MNFLSAEAYLSYYQCVRLKGVFSPYSEGLFSGHKEALYGNEEALYDQQEALYDRKEPL